MYLKGHKLKPKKWVWDKDTEEICKIVALTHIFRTSSLRFTVYEFNQYQRMCTYTENKHIQLFLLFSKYTVQEIYAKHFYCIKYYNCQFEDFIDYFT